MLYKRLWLLLVLPLSLWVSSCWAEVRLTDEEYQRIDQILTDLETINNEQKNTLNEQKNTLNEQEIQLDELQQEFNEQQVIISDLKKTTSEQEDLYKKEKRSLKTRGIVSSIAALGIGILLGVLLI